MCEDLAGVDSKSSHIAYDCSMKRNVSVVFRFEEFQMMNSF